MNVAGCADACAHDLIERFPTRGSALCTMNALEPCIVLAIELGRLSRAIVIMPRQIIDVS
jgi:hypothetical protein